MKKFLTITALVSLIVGLASAQNYYKQTLGGMPSVVPVSVQTNLASPPTIDCRQQQNVAVMVRGVLQNAGGVTNVIYVLQPGDGSYWDTSNVIQICWYPTTGHTNYMTNISVKGFPYLRLYSIINTNPTAIFTNTAVEYFVKTQSP